MKLNLLLPVLCSLLFFETCKQKTQTSAKPVEKTAQAHQKKAICCESGIPARFPSLNAKAVVIPGLKTGNTLHEGMVWINAGTFLMGGDNKQAAADEYPKHKVTVDGFWMDATGVTNAQFAKFVKATGYITTAERKPDWNVLKKQLPPGTSKPDDSLLIAASLVFAPPAHAVALDDYNQWWAWRKGANWKHPHGAGSNIKGKDNYPVVHIGWTD